MINPLDSLTQAIKAANELTDQKKVSELRTRIELLNANDSATKEILTLARDKHIIP